MPQVKVIQPVPEQAPRLRVAAYARVSSDSDDQLNSLAVQIDYYTALIQGNPDWDFVGIYADEGITGTSTKKRSQFNRLMDDCRAGLIDRVLVKSASRFARNTADGLAAVRELRQLGVTVAFEKEAFDTGDAQGEMLLSMIYAVAQEESISISKNLKWGIEKRMRAGTYINGNVPYGYALYQRQLISIPDEAEIVKSVFSDYLSGVGTIAIADSLNCIAPKQTGNWTHNDITRILRNEKYAGNVLMKKSYTSEDFPKKSFLNKGEYNQYYLARNHTAIISEKDFQKAAALRQRKSSRFFEPQTYPFSHMLTCALCGMTMSQKTTTNRMRRWVCITHLQSAEECPTKPVQEAELCRAFLYVYNKLIANKGVILNPVLDALERLAQSNTTDKPTQQQELLALTKRRHNLARLHAQGYIDSEQFLQRCSELDRQVEAQKSVLLRMPADSMVLDTLHKTQELVKHLEGSDFPTEFSAERFQKTVRKVIVSDEAFVFELINGIQIRYAR